MVIGNIEWHGGRPLAELKYDGMPGSFNPYKFKAIQKPEIPKMEYTPKQGDFYSHATEHYSSKTEQSSYKPKQDYRN